MGVTVVKAAGRLAGPGVVEAGGRRLEAPHIVIATGSVPVIPPVAGLGETGYWTNREATAVQEMPESVVVHLLGGLHGGGRAAGAVTAYRAVSRGRRRGPNSGA